MVMNCASKASAMSRAMVVLPTPGGPHRMQLCGWPDSKRQAQRHALAQQMLLADDLAQRARAQALGQRRMALAAATPGLPVSLPDHVRAGWRLELESVGRQRRVELEAGERQHRTLAKTVENVEHRQFAALVRDPQADPHAPATGRPWPWAWPAPTAGHPGPVRPAAQSRPARPSGPAPRRSAPPALSPAPAACLRAVTWFRSTSYIHSVWPSATMVCSNGFW